MKQTVLFLRNGQLFATKEAALAGIKAVAHKAGQPVVALYGEAGSVKLIFAIGTEEGKCEIMATDADLAALSSLVSELRADVDEINNNIDGKISDAIDALKGEGFEAENLAALEDAVVANEEAIAILNGEATVEGSVAKAIADSEAATKEAYEAADAQLKSDLEAYADQAEADAIAAAKTETENQVKAAKDAIDAYTVNGYAISENPVLAASDIAIADEDGHFAAENVEAALKELYTQAGAGSKVTMKSDAGEGDVATIYSFYQGGEDDAHKIGEINIGKELMVKEGTVEDDENGVPHLKLTINDEASTVVDIDLSKVFDVYTQGNGIVVGTDKKISVKKADDSEAFLVVDENGVAIKGVQTAIDNAKDAAIAAAKTETENQVKAAKEAIDAYTVNGIAISENPVLDGNNVEYSEGVSLNAQIDANAKTAADAVKAEEDRAKKAEADILDIIDDINAEAGKVKVDADDTADYLANKIVTGVADEANNTYAVTVTENADGALAVSVKIDTIDGGTY